MIGNAAKNGGSISHEFAGLRVLFNQALDAIKKNESHVEDSDTLLPIMNAIRKVYPVACEVNQADEIAALLRFQKEFGFNLVIAGAAEAHLLADRLAQNPQVSVLLKARTPPANFETQRSVEDSIVKLITANVRTGLTMGDTDSARNLRWEAGIAVEAGLSLDSAIASVTKNVADMFNLPTEGRIQVGQKANFLFFNANPLSLQSYIQLVASGNYVECLPKQK